MKHLNKLSEEVIHENPWYAYKHDTYEKPNGEVGDYYYSDLRGMAIIVPVFPDGRLLLILQSRYLTDKESVEFPGGGLRDGQTAIEAAREELLEETGYVADEFIKVGEFQPANGYAKDTTHVFMAHVSEYREMNLDDTEEIEVLYRRPDEIDEMIRRNDIWDGQTMATWALVHHHFLHNDK